jgi:hypothetical protein
MLSAPLRFLDRLAALEPQAILLAATISILAGLALGWCLPD